MYNVLSLKHVLAISLFSFVEFLIDFDRIEIG